MPQRHARSRAVAFAIILSLGLPASLAAPARSADVPIHIGVISSQTGPAASLGIPQRNTVAIEPTAIAGRTVEYVVLRIDRRETVKATKISLSMKSVNLGGGDIAGLTGDRTSLGSLGDVLGDKLKSFSS